MKQKRLKILFTLITAIAINTATFAESNTEKLAHIENHIFGHENTNLSENERLSKIENFIYGTSKSNKSNAERINQLKQDLGIAPEEKAQIASAAGNNNYSSSYYDEVEDYSNEPVDPTAQYPIVDNIEQSLLSKTYTTENIYKRLDRLEKQAYGKTTTGSLSERVERLSAFAKPLQKDTSNNYFANNDDYNYFSPDTTNAPPYSTDSAYIGGTLPSKSTYNEIALLEQELFGRTYPQNDSKTRISRLEKELLHKEFSAEPDDMRIDRLATVSNAQKSGAPYKENRLMQHVATGVQIGSMILMLLAMIL